MLEDNTSSDVVEIAKKRLATQSKPAPKPAQPVAATEKKAPRTTGAQKPQQGDKPEKTQQRPQTSQENRGRGRGQQQRPQTAGGDSKGEAREGGRGRGQRREGGQRDGQQQRPRFDKPRVRKEGEGAVSAVDTTTDGDKKRAGKSHTHDANAPRRGRQFDRSVSGTGRGRGLKKGGEGAHNWGKEGDQDVRRGTRTFQDKKGRSEGKVVVKGEDAPVEGVTEPLKETEETVQTPVEGEAPKEGETKVEEKKKEEEVDNTLTLEEYQKQQQEKRKNLPNFRPESAPAATATATATTDKKKKE